MEILHATSKNAESTTHSWIEMYFVSVQTHCAIINCNDYEFTCSRHGSPNWIQLPICRRKSLVVRSTTHSLPPSIDLIHLFACVPHSIITTGRFDEICCLPFKSIPTFSPRIHCTKVPTLHLPHSRRLRYATSHTSQSPSPSNSISSRCSLRCRFHPAFINRSNHTILEHSPAPEDRSSTAIDFRASPRRRSPC